MPVARAYSKLPTRRWLLATRVSTAPGNTVSRRTERPVATTARERVVGMPKRVHRLAHDVLAQHRTDRGQTVAAARERRGPRALEVDVAKAAVTVDDLSEQEGPPVAQTRRVLAELVAGVGLRHRSGPAGYQVADQQAQAIEAAQEGGVEAQLGGQRLVEHQQSRVENLLRLPGQGHLR